MVTSGRILFSAHQHSIMAEEEKREGEPAAAETTESSDTGFSNRRLHNYPLIRVSCSIKLYYVITCERSVCIVINGAL